MYKYRSERGNIIVVGQLPLAHRLKNDVLKDEVDLLLIPMW